MTLHVPEAHAKSPKTGSGCGCGCKGGCGGDCGCAIQCCDLECLVRPKFFCGQLLTDTDLAAMVEWSRNRFGLTRYRDGWGVVCGLEVTCSAPDGGHEKCPERDTGPTIWVRPGYAIDCCGNDLVVCEPLAVDLSKICRPYEDCCNPPPKPSNGTSKPQDPGAAGTKSDSNGDCWGALGRDQDLVAVDLLLRYHEDLGRGQTAMFRAGCSDVGSCEYTRVLEQPCVYAKLGDRDRRYGGDEEWKTWNEAFKGRRTRVLREIDDATGAGLKEVARYLRRHPPFRFCFLEELVCCLLMQATDAAKAAPDWASVVRFWLYFDWYLHQLECPCWSCRPDTGVPLARVLLRVRDIDGTRECRVMLIDPTPPYRRPLRKDECRPIRRGTIDLAQYLGQPPEYVADRLRLVGVALGPAVPADMGTLYSRMTVEEELPSWDLAVSRTLTPVVVKDPFNRECVVGFQP